MSAAPAIDVRGLTRSYRPRRGGPHTTVTALNGIDLAVEEGEVRGLLGPNGAGKTTLCKILSTVLTPTGGTARVLGHDVAADPRAVKPLVGIVFGGDRGLYGRLGARQNLQLWGALYGLHGAPLRHRITDLLRRVGLADRADDRVDGFSRGMKQRLHLARGLISDPRVLLLDEPTTGMDPAAALDFRDLIGELRAERRSILLTTHDMAEAESVCDRVTLMDHGEVIATDEPAALAARISAHERIEARNVPADVLDGLHLLPDVTGVTRDGDLTRIDVLGDAAVTAVLDALVRARVTELGTVRPGLAEVYLSLIGDGRGMQVTR
ncbi:ABC transporter ATP-binding protein [Streptomyces sp. ID05-04B]|uniref:ABC transporter ATP-binding protein n=1 Tax=unclassified Streptomyces TaxID=2593676 RepID=UPI000D1B61A5|nr:MULTISPECIES: ABC transporter ATP-binding protein [unclassified Streptomyces]AVV44172.1 ABC transporter ATP-binding protein [Streptomyces sp. P3]MDX5569911.1 ABC transporter ATP-binding protein [Streptomyces sp. ID05-04B]